MNHLHRILVPVDFSDECAGAVKYAIGLGAAEIHLLHVLTPRPLDFAMIERREADPRRAEAALQELSEFRARIPSNADLRLRVAEGDAAARIVEYAEEQQADAVVMPTRGRDRLERLLLVGSVTMKVLHALKQPVITGIQFEDHLPPESLRRVLCAVDLGPASDRVLCAALQASRRFNAPLSVVHAHAAPIYDEGWRESTRNAARQKLEELTARLGVQADLHVEMEQPPRAVSGLALKLAADLVVLGRGESDDLLGRLRAHAYEIIRLCHCPVVSV
jgi:nucleotide-binding universal stress UspA family protein